MKNNSTYISIDSNYIEFLLKRIKKTKKELESTTNLEIKISKGGKLCAYKEQLNYILTHSQIEISTIERGCVDLTTCKNGDILISALGGILKYVAPTEIGNYYDHIVEYCDDNLGDGTRTNNGYVFRNNKIPETDHDIVKIIHI